MAVLTPPSAGAAYIRVSTDGQMDLSPESQLDEILKYAKSHNISIPESFIFMESEGRSGKKAENRPQFQKMIASAKTVPRPFDCILVWKFSRFARNQDESTFYKGMLRKKLGIDVISISEPVLDGMYGRLIEMIIEWQDEFYSYNLAQDVTRGMKTKAKNGGWQSSPPLGYRISSHGCVPELVPEEAETVKLIFQKYTLENMSLHALAGYLNDLGLKTSRGNPFERRALEYILQNPVYTGTVRWNRTCHETGEQKDPSQWIIAPGSHPAVISEELFQQAGLKLQNERRRKNAKPAEMTKHWLSGLLKCSDCGRSLSSCVRRSKSTGSCSFSFQCSGYLKGTCKKNHYISEKDLVPQLLRALDGLCEGMKAAPTYRPAEPFMCRDDSSDRAEAILLRNRLKQLEQKEARIKHAYREGIDTLEEYRQGRRELEAERKAIISALPLQAAGPVQSGMLPDDPGTTSAPKELRTISGALNSGFFSNAQINAALKSILDRIEFDRGQMQIKIFYRLPPHTSSFSHSETGTNTQTPSG